MTNFFSILNSQANVTLPNPLASSSAGVSPRASISGQLPGGGGGGSRGGSQRNLAPQQASISIVSPMLGGEDFSSQQQQLNAATGPITGSDRIKRPVRRGSNASVSSKGSASSLK